MTAKRSTRPALVAVVVAIGCSAGGPYSRTGEMGGAGSSSGGSGGVTSPGGNGAGGVSSPGGGGGPSRGDGGLGASSGGAPGTGGTGGPVGPGVGGGAGVGAPAPGSGGRTTSTGGNGGRPPGTGGSSSGGAGGPGSGGARAQGGAGGGGRSNGSGGRGSGGGGGQAGRGIGGAGGGGTSNGGNQGTAGQRILSIDFVGGEAVGGAGGFLGAFVMAANETAGVKRAQNWNSAPGAAGSITSPVLADGSIATGTSVTWDAPNYADNPGVWRVGYDDEPGDIRMMNGMLNPCWPTPPASPVNVFSVSNLPSTLTTGGYDVYVFVLGGIRGGDTRMYQYILGTTTWNVTQTGPVPTTLPSPYPYVLAPDMGAGNYIVFRHVTGSSFTLSVKPGNTVGSLRAPINGVQLVWPSGS